MISDFNKYLIEILIMKIFIKFQSLVWFIYSFNIRWTIETQLIFLPFLSNTLYDYHLNIELLEGLFIQAVVLENTSYPFGVIYVGIQEIKDVYLRVKFANRPESCDNKYRLSQDVHLKVTWNLMEIMDRNQEIKPN